MGGWALVALVFVCYAVAARRLDRLSVTAPIVLSPPARHSAPGSSTCSQPIRTPKRSGSSLSSRWRSSSSQMRQPSSFDRPRATSGSRCAYWALDSPSPSRSGRSWLTWCFLSISWAEAALIAAILAADRRALGLAVVTNPAVPLRIRRALNIESGLNDGIATPFVTILLALVVAGAAEHGLGSRGRLRTYPRCAESEVRSADFR